MEQLKEKLKESIPKEEYEFYNLLSLYSAEEALKHSLDLEHCKLIVWETASLNHFPSFQASTKAAYDLKEPKSGEVLKYIINIIENNDEYVQLIYQTKLKIQLSRKGESKMREDVMKRLQEHYEEAKTLFPEDRIVGIFLQGSQNYNLDTYLSDVDTKLIVLPTFEEICFNQKPHSTTHIRKNNEHIDIKDLRLMFQTFRKQNMNFIEILFTDYFILNPLYENFWNELIKNNELIAHYNLHKAVSTMKGIASEKYHAMEHRYPSRIEVIDHFGGYDPKQLHHLVRIHDFLTNFVAGKPYGQCLKPIEEKVELLKDIKINGVGSLEEARELADKYFNEIAQIADDFRSKNPNKINPEVDELLDKIQRNIMKKALSRELMNDIVIEIADKNDITLEISTNGIVFDKKGENKND